MKSIQFIFIAWTASIAFGAHAAPSFLIHKDQIEKQCGDAIEKTKTALNQIAIATNLPDFQNTVVATEHALAEFDQGVEIPMFLGQVSPQKEIRQAGTTCEEKVKAFVIEVYFNEMLL